MLTGIKLITMASLMMAGGFTAVQAQEVTAADENQVMQTENIDKKITRSDAKNIVKEYLKSKNKHKKLRVGKIRKVRDSWKVEVVAANRIPVLTRYVNNKTGEITFKR